MNNTHFILALKSPHLPNLFTVITWSFHHPLGITCPEVNTSSSYLALRSVMTENCKVRTEMDLVEHACSLRSRE